MKSLHITTDHVLATEWLCPLLKGHLPPGLAFHLRWRSSPWLCESKDSQAYLSSVWACSGSNFWGGGWWHRKRERGYYRGNQWKGKKMVNDSMQWLFYLSIYLDIVYPFTAKEGFSIRQTPNKKCNAQTSINVDNGLVWDSWLTWCLLTLSKTADRYLWQSGPHCSTVATGQPLV